MAKLSDGVPLYHGGNLHAHLEWLLERGLSDYHLSNAYIHAKRCAECGKHWADYPSKLCPVCEYPGAI